MNTVDTHTSIASITLDVPDPSAAEDFYAVLGLGDRLRLRASEAPTSGFRGYTLSLIVSQPANADALLDAVIEAGAKALKPAQKSMWGYGGVVQAPDGAIWKVVTTAKKNTGPVTREIDDLVLLLGASDVAVSKRFYVDRGLVVSKSFARMYAEFEAPAGAIKLGLYKRKGLAKDAGVDPEGSGSHRLVVGGGSEPFTDPDGFQWEPVQSAR